jgi:hypothetical protein
MRRLRTQRQCRRAAVQGACSGDAARTLGTTECSLNGRERAATSTEKEKKEKETKERTKSQKPFIYKKAILFVVKLVIFFLFFVNVNKF